MPRNIWKRKTIAVAPYAVPRVPMLSKIAASEKHRQSPLADVMSKGRLPKRSIIQRGIAEPIK